MSSTDPFAWLEATGPAPVANWLAAQARRLETAFAPEVLGELQSIIRDAMQSRALVTPPLQRGAWCFRFDAGACLWRQAPVRDDGTLGPWGPLRLDVDPALVDPVRTSNFVVCPYLLPEGAAAQRVMVRISPGGADAAESREFDLATGQEVPGGLRVARSVHHLVWDGPDALLVSRRALDEAGTSRWVVERLERERPQEVRQIHTFPPDRVAASIVRDPTAAEPRYLMTEWLDHRRREYSLCLGNPARGPWVRLPVPGDVRFHVLGDVALLVPLGSWPTPEGIWSSGDLLAAPLSDLLEGRVTVRLVHRTPTSARMRQLSFSRSRALISQETSAGASLLALEPVSGQTQEILSAGPGTSVRAAPVDVSTPAGADDCWVETVGPLTPPTLLRMDARHPSRTLVVEQGRSSFADTDFTVSLRRTVTASVPPVPVDYVVVAPMDLARDGDNPTLLSGYGGFSAHERIDYLDLTGPTWLDRQSATGRRCVFVHAYLGRGAKPDDAPWTRLSLSVEQFLAVADALEADGITRPARLGATGVSHGGLVVMNAMLRRPSSFGAVVCRAAVLDLLGYPDLDGMAWAGEYGDPRDEHSREAIRANSPYHQIAAGRRYPPVLLWSSTDDDRVSPAHSRKTAARLDEVGADVLYLETDRGGHDALGSTASGAHGLAVSAAFFTRHLCAGLR